MGAGGEAPRWPNISFLRRQKWFTAKSLFYRDIDRRPGSPTTTATSERISCLEETALAVEGLVIANAILSRLQGKTGGIASESLPGMTRLTGDEAPSGGYTLGSAKFD